ncbi:MAG: hypothetical protein HYV07_08510 [Deltaproteobacteria bacterium]|nr:hypothetical protein [Deltaproteobacteria bacterium]
MSPEQLIARVLAPDAAPGAFNDFRLVTGTSLPVWAIVLFAVLLFGSIGASALGLRRLSIRRRVLVLGLRTLAAALVLALVCLPEIELRAVSRVRSRVAIVIDDSRSMSLATRQGTRSEAVLRHLSSSLGELQTLATEGVLEVSLFGDRTRPVEGIPASLRANENGTDLLRPLRDVSGPASGRNLGVVILYSDGADTTGLDVERARALGAEVGAPIYTIGFAAEDSAPDLAIRRIVSDDFAFVHNSVTVEVELERHGLALKSVPVTLNRENDVVATKEAIFDSQGRARVSFELKPTRIGRQTLEVSVPVQPNEAVSTNNSKSVVLKVIRDRIRILQVVGHPSWDERFLRELLKRNPNVDLISFFILRSATDLQKAPQEELSLIPFPIDELFTEELPGFDIVIYQNFSYRPYRMARYLRNVRDYVVDGGSFLMIGGRDSFEDGWYAETPVETILPITLGGAPAYDPGEFRPRLTLEGRRHPIALIGEPGEPPDLAYERLPPLEGINSSLGLAPDAQALLIHPSLPGNPPVVAIREVGDGRSMAVTTDSLWYWRFVAVGEGRAGREFDRFWNAALRWLVRDPELARVRVEAKRSVVPLGTPVSAEAKVLGPDYHGLPGAEIMARLVSLDGGDTLEQRVVAGSDGVAPLTFEHVEPGSYSLRVEAHGASGEPLGRADEPLVVEGSDVEREAPFPRPELLRALAEASGGQFLTIDEAFPKIDLSENRRVEVDRSRREPIWDSWLAYVLLLGLLASEWWVRRRGGLL